MPRCTKHNSFSLHTTRPRRIQTTSIMQFLAYSFVVQGMSAKPVIVVLRLILTSKSPVVCLPLRQHQIIIKTTDLTNQFPWTLILCSHWLCHSRCQPGWNFMEEISWNRI